MPVIDGTGVGTGENVGTGGGAGGTGDGAGDVGAPRDFERAAGFAGVAGGAGGGAGGAVTGGGVTGMNGIVMEKVRGAFDTALVSRRGERDHKTMPVPRTFSAEGVNVCQAF